MNKAIRLLVICILCIGIVTGIVLLVKWLNN